jgi:hypothetical protein
MSSLLGSLSGLMDAGALGTIGKLAGDLSPDLVQKGMGVAGPLLQKGMARAASTPEGLSSIMGLLEKTPAGGAEGMLSSLTSLTSLAGAGGVDSIAGALSNLSLGTGGSAATSLLSNRLGFDIKPLIAAAAPLLLGQLKKLSAEQGLDAHGIARLLKGEARAFDESGSPETALVNEAWDFGAQAAEIRSKFTDTEWSSVRKAPLAAAAAVIMASPNKFSGGGAELRAFGETMTAEGRSAVSSLVSLAFGDGVDLDELAAMAKYVTRADVMNVLKNAVGAVEAKDPAHASQFNDLLVRVAGEVAAAAREGGFLGFGGKQISDAEAAVLDEIRTIAR